jgi:DNA-binding winged helix-turn-helix (wHTH) protein
MRSPRIWRVGEFEIDVAQRKLSRSGADLPLQARPFDVLCMLVQNVGKLVRREDLLRDVWRDAHVQDAALTNTIAVLRKTLSPGAIETVSKHGYRLAAPFCALPAASRVASDLLAEGQRQMAQRQTEAVTKARNLFWRAIAEEPSFAEAWAWLARACRFLEKGGVERDDHRAMVEAAFCRAFELEPDLACAHQFYTLFQADRGHAADAMKRLLGRIKEHPEDAHSYAGLVQVCRFCGLLDASVAAHRRATKLMPDIQTSVPHTYFVACDYPSVVESYALVAKGGPRGYLDTAAWACLGARERVEAEIAERLADRAFPPVFQALLESMLCAIRGDGAGAQAAMEACALYEDPESVLYFARHLAYAGRSCRALELLSEVVKAGFTTPVMLERDPWLAKVRRERLYPQLLRDAIARHKRADKLFQNAGGPQLLLRRG